MIVVIGSPFARPEADRIAAAGMASAIAIAAATAGLAVQLVGRIGDDRIADAVLADLSRQGVGHVAILRDAAHPTPSLGVPGTGDAPDSDQGLPLDALDVSLALRYLVDLDVIVLTPGATPDVLEVVAEAAGWAGASIVMIDPGATDGPDVTIPSALAIRPSGDESPPAFTTRVAELVVREAALRSAR